MKFPSASIEPGTSVLEESTLPTRHPSFINYYKKTSTYRLFVVFTRYSIAISRWRLSQDKSVLNGTTKPHHSRQGFYIQRWPTIFAPPCSQYRPCRSLSFSIVVCCNFGALAQPHMFLILISLTSFLEKQKNKQLL